MPNKMTPTTLAATPNSAMVKATFTKMLEAEKLRGGKKFKPCKSGSCAAMTFAKDEKELS